MDPAILQQAVGRAHRMGQTRPVHVTRLIMHSTVEVGCCNSDYLCIPPPTLPPPPPAPPLRLHESLRAQCVCRLHVLP